MAKQQNEHGKWKGLIWLNAELKVLGRKTDPASRERYEELVDELITLDMAMGPVRRAMGRAAEEAKKQKPEEPAEPGKER